MEMEDGPWLGLSLGELSPSSTHPKGQIYWEAALATRRFNYLQILPESQKSGWILRKNLILLGFSLHPLSFHAFTFMGKLRLTPQEISRALEGVKGFDFRGLNFAGG